MRIMFLQAELRWQQPANAIIFLLFIFINSNATDARPILLSNASKNRIPNAIITDGSVLEYFNGNETLANIAIFNQIESTKQIFCKQSFGHYSGKTYQNFGPSLSLIVHNPEDLSDLNLLKEYDVDELEKFLFNNQFVKTLMDKYSSVGFYTIKKVKAKNGTEYDGFSFGIACSSRNLYGISFVNCAIDLMNGCNVTSHETGHQWEAKHTNKTYNNLMQKTKNNLVFDKDTISEIAIAISYFEEEQCFQEETDTITVISSNGTSATINSQIIFNDTKQNLKTHFLKKSKIKKLGVIKPPVISNVITLICIAIIIFASTLLFIIFVYAKNRWTNIKSRFMHLLVPGQKQPVNKRENGVDDLKVALNNFQNVDEPISVDYHDATKARQMSHQLRQRISRNRHFRMFTHKSMPQKDIRTSSFLKRS